MDLFSLPDWYAALDLDERISGRPPWAGGSSDVGSSDRAARRMARWWAQPPFSQDGLFDRRLARAGLDRNALLALLGEAPAALAARIGAPPVWLEELHRSFLTTAPERFPLSSDRKRSPNCTFRGDLRFGNLIRQEVCHGGSANEGSAAEQERVARCSGEAGGERRGCRPVL